MLKFLWKRPRGMARLTRAAIGLVLGWTVLLAAGLGVAAQEPGDVSAEDVGFGNTVLQGVAPTFTLFLPGPGLAEVALEGNFLRVDFAHSQVLEGTSTVRIDFNNVPLTSLFLTNETATGGQVEIPIPGDAINRNVNGITFLFFMRISDNICRDWSNPALTATIFNSTFIHYELTGRRLTEPTPAAAPAPAPTPGPAPVIERNLETYPIPLLDLRKPVPDPITIVLPAAPGSEDLSAAVAISAALGHLGQNRPAPELRVVRAGELTADLRNETNLAIIGTPSANAEIARLAPTLPLPFDGSQFFDARGNPLPPGSAVIAYAESPANPERTVLLVSGGSARSIRQAALVLSSDRLLATLSGPFALISPDLEDEPKLAPPSVTRIRRSLAELGAADLSVAGAGERTAAVGFLAPPPGADNTLTLEVTHSALLSTLSTLDVVVNGVLVSTLDLDNIGAGDRAATVSIPGAALNAGFNTLAFRFQLLVDEQLNCGDLIARAQWGSVLSSSMLDLEVGRPQAPSFVSLPHPFLTPDGFGSTVVVTDPADDLDGLVTLALELGRVSPSEENFVRVVTPDAVDATLRSENDLILYGTFGVNTFFDAVAESVPLRFDPDVGLILQGRAGELLGARGATDLAVLQIIASPFNPDRRVLMVAATSPDLLTAGARAVGSLSLDGNLATITADGNVSTLSVLLPAPPPSAADRAAAFGLSAPVLAAVGAALALLVLIGAIALQTYQRPGRG